MDATKTYEFIGFGAMDATKPYEFMGFGLWTPNRTFELQAELRTELLSFPNTPI